VMPWIVYLSSASSGLAYLAACDLQQSANMGKAEILGKRSCEGHVGLDKECS
jgi:hypothetical protein